MEQQNKELAEDKVLILYLLNKIFDGIKNATPNRIEYFFNFFFFISRSPSFYQLEQMVSQYLFARTNKSVMPES